MTDKPKTIYKNGLRWNLVPKEAYGKEIYVPCNFPFHCWELSIKEPISCDKMTNTKFKERLKQCDEFKTQFKKDKQEFKYDVCRFMESRGIPVTMQFFGDTFGVDIHITSQNVCDAPTKIPLNVLMDFCNEFGCEFEYTKGNGNRYIFSFNKLDMGF